MLFGDAPTPPEALGEHTGFLLNWVGMRSRRAFAEAIGELGLRPPHFAAMAVIAARPGLTQQELVGLTGIDPSSMVTTIDALEAEGHAERRPHPTDRRKREVHLTEAGLAQLDAARARAAAAGDQVFAALSAEEREALHGLLRKVAGLPG